MFNPRPVVRYVPLPGMQTCVVVDDVLLEPHALVAQAVARRDQFAIDPDNYYPGCELALDAAATMALDTFFTLHIRRALGARRTLHASARLALATLQGAALHGLQRTCHRDAVTLPPGEGVAACVVYLFDRPAMGGTSFYAARQPDRATAAYLQRVADAVEVPPAAYLTGSNDWFEQVCTVPARFNRAIFYDGTVFHAAQIEQPALLRDDPASGRLTMNGFFRVRKAAV